MINIGDKYNLSIVVVAKDTAIAHKSGGLEVFATPAMVALMENSAYSLLKEAGLDSVGTEINVKHLKASLVGTKIDSCATITSINDKWIGFNVECRDEKGVIGSGSHTRYIINPEKFMNKLKG